MAVLKRWNGSAWEVPVLYRYTGTTWECVDLNRHTGSTWEDVQTACAEYVPPVPPAISVRLAGGYLEMPNNAANTSSSDIELIMRIKLDDWAFGQFFANKDSWPDANNRTWAWGRSGLDNILFWWWPDGTSGSENQIIAGTGLAGFTDNTYYWLKLSFDANNGAGNRVFTVSWANDQATIPSSWTVLTSSSGPVATMGNSATGLKFCGSAGHGNFPANVKYFSFSPVVGGAPTAVFDASLVLAESPTSPSSSAQVGGTWTLMGSATWEVGA